MPNHHLRADKPKNSRLVFKLVLKSIKEFRFLIIISIVLTVGSAIFGLFIPKILGEMTTIAVNSYPNWIGML